MQYTNELYQEYSSSLLSGFSLYTFSPRLQCLVHLFKPTLRVAIQTAAKQTDQQPAKPLALLKPHFPFTQGLDQKTMLTIEDATEEELAHALPPTPCIRRKDDTRYADTLTAAGLDSDPKPLPLPGYAGNRFDEGIPLRVRGEIR